MQGTGRVLFRGADGSQEDSAPARRQRGAVNSWEQLSPGEREVHPGAGLPNKVATGIPKGVPSYNVPVHGRTADRGSVGRFVGVR